MRYTPFLALLLSLVFVTSCVSKKKYDEALAAQQAGNQSMAELRASLDDCNKRTADLNNQMRLEQQQIANKDGIIQRLEEQLKDTRQTNAGLLQQMEQLSVISTAGAQNITRSLENMDRQQAYIKELTGKIQTKDSTNLALVMNLKRSLDNVNDTDVEVKVRGGVVYVSLSDKMLFQSGGSTITPRAAEVLAKVAKIVNDQPDLNVMVEGHTDNVPINTNCTPDNWALSSQRAATIVRELQTKYGVAPSRLIAAGRSSYAPKADNATAEGRSTNRRTEIIILPKLDQFFKLMEAPADFQPAGRGK